MGRLDDKVALITGAASGIGRVAAELFSAEGARVTIADVVDADGEAAVAAITAAGGEAVFVHADVSDAAQAEAMVEFAVDTFGRLDVLYNNAGILPGDDAGTLETPEATWDRVLAVNLKGVWLGMKFGIPALLASGGGTIVNVSSLVALVGHRQQGGSARDDTRDGGRIRPPGDPGQRAVPRPGRHPAHAPADVRPGVGRTAPRSHPDGPARRRGGDRPRRAVPRVRRVIVHDRRRARGRRGNHSGLRHARVRRFGREILAPPPSSLT